jgi:uncharacterized membrane protein YagU involved in acid resistance
MPPHPQAFSSTTSFFRHYHCASALFFSGTKSCGIGGREQRTPVQIPLVPVLPMTRDEFVSKKSESERRIRRSVVPVGIIYAIRLASVFGFVYCGVIQWRFYGITLYKPMLVALGLLFLLFGVTFPLARTSIKRFKRLALKCPACQGSLVFTWATKTVETGCCCHCGQRVFEA